MTEDPGVGNLSHRDTLGLGNLFDGLVDLLLLVGWLLGILATRGDTRLLRPWASEKTTAEG